MKIISTQTPSGPGAPPVEPHFSIICQRHGLQFVDATAIGPKTWRVWVRSSWGGRTFAAIVHDGALFLPALEPETAFTIVEKGCEAA